MIRTLRLAGVFPSSAQACSSSNFAAVRMPAGSSLDSDVHGPARQVVQQAEDLVDIREDVGFGASERRQSDPGEPVLQCAHIVPAQPDVVNQVRGTGCVVRVHRLQRIVQTRLQRDEIRPQRGDLIDRRSDHLGVPRLVRCLVRRGLPRRALKVKHRRPPGNAVRETVKTGQSHVTSGRARCGYRSMTVRAGMPS